MEQPQDVYCLLCDYWQLLGMVAVIAIVAYLAVFYFWGAFCWMKIAQKLEHKHPFLAWIPIAQLIFGAELAGLPDWVPVILVLGLVIPLLPVQLLALLGLVLFGGYAIWIISEKLSKPYWYALGSFVPLLQLWIFYDMAWKETPQA